MRLEKLIRIDRAIIQINNIYIYLYHEQLSTTK